MSKEVEEIEHDYINEDKAVNYICINGQEYVIGEYDSYDEALKQLELIIDINDGVNAVVNAVDWISSRPGANIK